MVFNEFLHRFCLILVLVEALICLLLTIQLAMLISMLLVLFAYQSAPLLSVANKTEHNCSTISIAPFADLDCD